MNGRNKLSTWSMGLLWVLMALLLAAASIPANAAGCPSVQAIANFKADNDVTASFAISNNNTQADYTFISANENPVAGVPGLIEYCVYPAEPPGNPTSKPVVDTTAFTGAVGDNGDKFQPTSAASQGYFGFKRKDGDPSNIGLDGSTRHMGSATWPVNPNTGVGIAPEAQTILLHINDAADCQALYGGTSQTCFVYPGGGTPPPPCNANPACKSVVIDESDSVDENGVLIVPGGTLLHIHYTYVIVDQASNSFSMTFNPPSSSTKDINSGGGKDYFGCEQGPDANGAPGAAGFYPNYQGTGFNLNLTINKDTQPLSKCQQSRFTLVAPPSGPITLSPGDSVSFTMDMVTKKNSAGKQEYTSCGLHLLNSGFTVKWFQSDDGLLHSFSTSITPIYVDVVGNCH